MQVWQSRLTPISGTHRLIACVQISNICNIASVTTARLTITENTVIILCDKGVSFHFVFIVYSTFLLPSLSKALFRAFSVKKIGTIKVTVFTKLTIAFQSPQLPPELALEAAAALDAAMAAHIAACWAAISARALCVAVVCIILVSFR